MRDADPVCDIWAEHWPAVSAFLDACTQWRMGPGGPIGLDYSALPPACRPGFGGRRGRARFEHLQVMEAEALRWFAAKAQA